MTKEEGVYKTDYENTDIVVHSSDKKSYVAIASVAKKWSQLYYTVKVLFRPIKKKFHTIFICNGNGVK